VWNGALGILRGAWNGMLSAVQGGGGSIISFVAGLPGRVLGALGNLGSMLWNAGTNMMRGFVNGVASMAHNLVNSALDAVGRAVDAVKNFLGIGSPSKLFAQFGEWTGEGMVIGMKASERLLATEGQRMVEAMTGPLSAQKMRTAGSDAARSLTDGLLGARGSITGAMASLSSGLEATANVRVGRGGLVSGIPDINRPRAGVVQNFAEGALQVVTPTKDPELVSHRVVDEMAESISTFL
jgi:hypothetical protein